jgi:hypothetical protein
MSKWYTISCAECGTEIHVHEDWSNPPSICNSCKADRAAQWYEKSCERCGATIRVHRDWDHPPKFCVACKKAYVPQTASCSHCGKSFTISTGIQIKCRENGWDLPKRCDDCRELFRHKPFETVRETGWLGNTVFRTYNSIGQLIGESRDEMGFLGDKRRVHYSSTGKMTGVTSEETDLLGSPYRETTGADGRVKSTSRERTDLLGKYTERTGGTSGIMHRTRTIISWIGQKIRKTE